MLSIRHHPELVTPQLEVWLRSHVFYDDNGRASRVLKAENQPMPPLLAPIAEKFGAGNEVILQAYRDGMATTPCHSDGTITGFSFILSIGAARTLRIHPIEDECGPDQLNAIFIECVNGSVFLMNWRFQAAWHHQIIEDPDVKDERLSLVFRTAKL